MKGGLLLVFGVAGYLTGCLTCTLADCSGVALNFSLAEDNGKSHGEYTLRANGVTCTIRLSGAADGAETGGAGAVEAGGAGGEGGAVAAAGAPSGGASGSGEADVQCDSAPPFELLVSQDQWWGFSYAEKQTSVDVTITLDGEVLVDDTFVPVYEMNYPNGQQCGPSCEEAVIELDLGPNG